jgi:hypothetical protein
MLLGLESGSFPYSMLLLFLFFHEKKKKIGEEDAELLFFL